MYRVDNLPMRDLLALTVRDPAASELLIKFPTIKQLSEAAPEELTQVKGLGICKARQLLAAIELGKRIYAAPANKIVQINCPQDVYDLLVDMRLLNKEYFKAIYLNTKNFIIDVQIVSIGSLNSSVVHPREAFQMAIKRSANSMIIVHNHPSSDPTPSNEDIEVTKRLVEAGRLIGIEVVDHVIIGAQTYVSMKERGII